MRRLLAAAALLALPSPLLAHAGRPALPHDAWTAWSRDPLVLAGLALSLLVFERGHRAARRPSAREAWAFRAGWLVLAVALASPLHAIGEALFSAHMVQHELLVALAAPLLVLGRPALAAVWALPPRWRGRVRVVTARAGVRRAWRTLTAGGPATLLHGVALWVWHLPALYRLSLRSDLVHALQHVSFLGTALLFWWALLSPRARREHAGAGVAWLFVTAMHTVALGTLLALSSRLWVPAYASTTAAWGLMPVEDQQLAGLIMWVPGTASYLVAGLALFSAWLTASGERVRRRALAGALPAALVALLVVAGGCQVNTPDDLTRGEARTLTRGGDADQGRRLIRAYGCGNCHTVPGVPGAEGMVGPELTNTGRRTYIAGVLTNTPDHMIRWIQHPRQVDSLTAMPELGVTEREARDMAAYIYSLR